MGEWRAGGGSGSAGIVVRMSVAGVRSWRGRELVLRRGAAVGGKGKAQAGAGAAGGE
jgi:hypothetical protein